MDYKFCGIIVLFLLIFPDIYSQDITVDFNVEDEYFDFGIIGGTTIYAERPFVFAPESIEANIVTVLNGTLPERRNFIENDLLNNSGFRRTGNVRFRKTDGGEKALSVLHGIGHLFSFGIVPMTRFSEIEFDRLPNGLFYSFQTVINASELNNISPEVILLMEIEYKLQIEFNNGILYSGNINYFTNENINFLERLLLGLPEFPENINRLRKRYLNIELPKIRNSLYRRNNPSENYQRAMENLGGTFGRIEN